MKVYVDGKMYDADITPIVLFCSHEERIHMAGAPPTADRIAFFNVNTCSQKEVEQIVYDAAPFDEAIMGTTFDYPERVKKYKNKKKIVK